MNLAHDVLCSSRWWARAVQRELLPWGLHGVELGPDVLELGPGFGATTRVLAGRPFELTVLEPEQRYCERLRRDGDHVTVVQGDATQMPFEDGRFSGVVCFTMLHHVASLELQDRLLAEAARVLRPEGVFAGTNSVGQSRMFKAIHIGEHHLLVDPSGLAPRLESAGFTEVRVDASPRSLRFGAHKPA